MPHRRQKIAKGKERRALLWVRKNKGFAPKLFITSWPTG